MNLYRHVLNTLPIFSILTSWSLGGSRPSLSCCLPLFTALASLGAESTSLAVVFISLEPLRLVPSTLVLQLVRTPLLNSPTPNPQRRMSSALPCPFSAVKPFSPVFFADPVVVRPSSGCAVVFHSPLLPLIALVWVLSALFRLGSSSFVLHSFWLQVLLSFRTNNKKLSMLKRFGYPTIEKTLGREFPHQKDEKIKSGSYNNVHSSYERGPPTPSACKDIHVSSDVHKVHHLVKRTKQLATRML